VHYGQDLASLADESKALWAKPLGPLGDEG